MNIDESGTNKQFVQNIINKIIINKIIINKIIIIFSLRRLEIEFESRQEIKYI
jgi:hypothetical protein